MLKQVYPTMNIATSTAKQDCEVFIQSPFGMGTETIGLLARGIYPNLLYVVADRSICEEGGNSANANESNDNASENNGNAGERSNERDNHTQYVTPQKIHESKNIYAHLKPHGNLQVPELSTITVDELCAYYDEHPRMMQFINNKHRSLKRSLPLTRSFNISDLFRSVFDATSRCARISSTLSESYFFTGDIANINNMEYNRGDSRSEAIQTFIRDYIYECTSITTNLYGQGLSSILALMTSQSLNLSKTRETHKLNTGLISFDADLIGSLRTHCNSGYVPNINNLSILKVLNGVILHLTILGAIGKVVIPKLATYDLEASGHAITRKTELMYTLFNAKLLPLCDELVKIAEDLYTFLYKDVELSKALQTINLSPQTKLSDLGDIVSYYIDTGDAGSSNVLGSHFIVNPLLLDSKNCYGVSVHLYSDIYPRITEVVESDASLKPRETVTNLIENSYGGIDTLGALSLGRICSFKNNVSGSINALPRIYSHLIRAYNNAVVTSFLRTIESDIWGIFNLTELPWYMTAHIVLINTGLYRKYLGGAMISRAQTFRECIFQQLPYTSPGTNTDTRPEEQSPTNWECYPNITVQASIANSVLESSRSHLATGVHKIKNAANIVSGSGGIYCRDYNTVEEAQKFKPITIGNPKE